jgi:PleD family two-component response regulator
MILPHTFEKGGVEVAERLRRNIAAWVFPLSTTADVRLTLSIGLCSYPQDGMSPPEMIEAAQRALAAKAMGGNQATDPRSPQPRVGGQRGAAPHRAGSHRA